MRVAIITSVAALALSACSQQDAPPQGDEAVAVVPASQPAPEPVAAPTAKRDQNALEPQGLGDIIVGQPAPTSLVPDAVQVSDGCRTYTDKARRIYAMSDGKVVARITAMKGSTVKTARGIAVGASEAAVRNAYPDATPQPHKYVDAPAKYLDWRPGGGDSGLRFEIDSEGKVSAIHAGREPEIEYVEGCA